MNSGASLTNKKTKTVHPKKCYLAKKEKYILLNWASSLSGCYSIVPNKPEYQTIRPICLIVGQLHLVSVTKTGGGGGGSHPATHHVCLFFPLPNHVPVLETPFLLQVTAFSLLCSVFFFFFLTFYLEYCVSCLSSCSARGYSLPRTSWCFQVGDSIQTLPGKFKTKKTKVGKYVQKFKTSAGKCWSCYCIYILSVSVNTSHWEIICHLSTVYHC